ncbi:MAG: membrane protein insertion efficiency factor YidD [Caldisericaceae bacterium]
MNDKVKKSFGTRALLYIIAFYRKYISPLKPPTCRFIPTCSEYSFEAINKYGVKKGGWLAIKRILRCNPYFPGGHDPVP